MDHNFSAYSYGYDAFQSGYDDEIYDGVNLVDEISCQCSACRRMYANGQDAAREDMKNTQRRTNDTTDLER